MEVSSVPLNRDLPCENGVEHRDSPVFHLVRIKRGTKSSLTVPLLKGTSGPKVLMSHQQGPSASLCTPGFEKNRSPQVVQQGVVFSGLSGGKVGSGTKCCEASALSPQQPHHGDFSGDFVHGSLTASGLAPPSSPCNTGHFTENHWYLRIIPILG